jgi:hypothetical protein
LTFSTTIRTLPPFFTQSGPDFEWLLTRQCKTKEKKKPYQIDLNPFRRRNPFFIAKMQLKNKPLRLTAEVVSQKVSSDESKYYLPLY